ncbi:MAG: transglycosylase domain-containing protein [Kiritimatiellaeota bacterium]|nr:transglycosylase domain-containing protein [Kiritimatiellota bacterium]
MALALAIAWFACPFPRELLAWYPAAVVLCDREGTPLRVRLGPRDQDCRPIYQPQRDDWIVKAIVAAEDRRFWRHGGVDPAAVLRAAWLDVTRLRKVSGASTLSMQVIRLAQPRPRTLWAKIIEIFRALQMERLLSKDEILTQYLNRTPFGANLVGIEAASRRYFGKGPEDLSLAEAALLAGVPQSPARLRPDRRMARARQRQAYVLDRMVASGCITAEQRCASLSQQLVLRSETRPFRAPHFCDLAEARLAAARFVGGTSATLQSGEAPSLRSTSRRARGAGGSARDRPPAPEIAVRTTLDPKWQRVAEEALRRHAVGLMAGEIRGGAVVILEVQTGAVRALVGSPDFFDQRHQGQVNAALAARSAGSTLKPFAFALAFDRGLATPGTVLADVPRNFGDYRPDNFDKHFRGLLSARDALILSLNLPALEIEQAVGQPVLWRTLRQLGLETIEQPAAHYGMGLVLGNAEVRLLDLANAYACLARGGEWRPVRVFEDAVAAAGRRLFSPEACWLVADALGGQERALDATGHAADVRLPPLAWKTGTSSGFHDAWTVAFNPEIVIGVWAGNPDGAGSDLLVGKKVAAPVVWEIFRRLYPDNDGPWFTRPAGLALREVCAASGGAPGPYCRDRIEDWSISGVTSCRACDVHVRAPDTAGRLAEVWPPEVTQFLARQFAAQAPPAAKAARLRITSPAPGSAFRLIEGLAGAEQRLPLSAAGVGGVGALHWFDNDRYLGAVRGGESLFWPLARGAHQFVVCDAAGLSDRVKITVE